MGKVCILGGNSQYVQMYLNRGFEPAELAEADLVQFTGGHDVSPVLYGETRHEQTVSNSARDAREARAFKLALQMGKPMAGICRGGQFLNVMCGGSMFQHVDNHARAGTHPVYDVRTKESIPCTSTHHQMMRAGPAAELIGVASEATVLESMKGGSIHYVKQKRGQDVEVLFYREQRALCFQPHPEFLDRDSLCQQWYFDLIEDLLEVA